MTFLQQRGLILATWAHNPLILAATYQQGIYWAKKEAEAGLPIKRTPRVYTPTTPTTLQGYTGWVVMVLEGWRPGMPPINPHNQHVLQTANYLARPQTAFWQEWLP